MTISRRPEAAGRVVLLITLLALAAAGGAAGAPDADGDTDPDAVTTSTAEPAALLAGDSVDEAVERLVGQLENPATRRAAREALVAAGPAAVAPLLPFLDDPEMTVRWEVATILGTIADPAAVPALIQRTVVDDNPHVRWRSLWSLSRFDGSREEVVGSLRQLISSPRDRERWNAAVALSMFGEDDGVPLLNAGVWHLDPWRRWEAINALGRVHDAASVQVLASVLAADRPRERQEAVLSLGKIGGERAVSLLVAALDDPAEDVRWRACLALGKVGNPGVRPALEAVIHEGESSRVVKYAREALSHLDAAGW
jgi:HEAT repeat protein